MAEESTHFSRIGMKIFIVHAPEEAVLARAVQAQLERCFARQVPVSLDEDVPIGRDWMSWRTQTLSEADLIFVLMSGASCLNPEIASAAGYGFHSGKKVVPLWSRDVTSRDVSRDYLVYRPIFIDDGEAVGKLLDEIARSTPAGRLFEQKDLLVTAWLDEVRAATRAPSAPDRDPAEARRLLAEHYAAYRAGEMAIACLSIKLAYDLDPLNPEVAYRFVVALLRYDRLTAIQKLLGTLKERGVYDDRVRMIEGEFLLRQRRYREARDVLDEIRDDRAYNVLYLKGMSYLLDYGVTDQIAALLKAKEFLVRAHDTWPDHWWVTLNLAIAQRLLSNRDATTEALALEQLNAAAVADPLKASPRMYRLLYFALKGDLEDLRRQIEADFEDVAGQLELPTDLLDWIQDRLRMLLRHDPATLSRFMEEITRWANAFRVLSWPPRRVEPA